MVDEVERELMRDQVAATLAAGMIVAEGKVYTPANAAKRLREVRAELYPPEPVLDAEPKTSRRASRREQPDNWKLA